MFLLTSWFTVDSQDTSPFLSGSQPGSRVLNSTLSTAQPSDGGSVESRIIDSAGNSNHFDLREMPCSAQSVDGRQQSWAWTRPDTDNSGGWHRLGSWSFPPPCPALRQGSGRRQALYGVLSDGRNNANRRVRCSGVRFFSINKLMLVTLGQRVHFGAWWESRAALLLLILGRIFSSSGHEGRG